MKRYILMVFIVGSLALVAHASTQFDGEWESLTSRQKQLWKTWADTHPMFLEASGYSSSLNGRWGFDIALHNRFMAHESLNPASLPLGAIWSPAALSPRDAGPFTMGIGYMGFRADERLATTTKWFVWATPPLRPDTANPEMYLQFITVLSVPPIDVDGVTLSFASEYRAVLGSYNGPGEDGEWWPDDHFVWFRIQQYFDGQLGPAVIFKGRISTEL